ncbi:HD family phosphohydrolase [Breznakiella homolactica]|uniref:HDIG domain-containing protein n=1 Tax=Breznakiella homolactica TaxID=2798577 RepID=A0A7T7XL60_9SPIR|nr:HDIG domain-containing metalloprotein [Breznakiella homolactica]QQO08292.1 HDIG domain-containing protein [Breznakiella homolactica]
MTTKKNRETAGKSPFLRLLKPAELRRWPTAAVLSAFAVSVIVVCGGTGYTSRANADLREFEVGKVAERDVTAEQMIAYVDEDATRLRLEAQERLVPAVFKYSMGITQEITDSYRRFAALSQRLFDEGVSAEAYKLAVQSAYPGAFRPDTLDALFRDPARGRLLDFGYDVLESILESGVFAIPQIGLEQYNPDTVELLHTTGPRVERERVSYDKVITRGTADSRIVRIISSGSYPSSFAAIAPELLKPFITENVFFSSEDTEQRLAETRAQVEPVVKEIKRGEQVIRKGFIITKDDMVRLRALDQSLAQADPGRIIGRIIVLTFVFALFCFLMSSRIIGRKLTAQEVYFLAILGASYVIGAVFINGVSFNREYFMPSVLFPTALMVMLPAILINTRAAVAAATVLPLAAFVSGSFDGAAFTFALISGFSAAYTLQGAERRMDLVKAGFIIAGTNCIGMFAILLIQHASVQDTAFMLLWAALNGIISGMIVLGFLPLLENALNTATTFRLIELSDLNSPILKRLLTMAPGTYSHSVMVANLAESACQDIGANALLARVGAYYHDIGKMEQADYFIENQTAYNKHEDIAPRLSATVIRSHVKIGVEKARNMGLPKEVVDIIGQHHGNSVISWFYNEALKRESQVNVEDFTYPGSPPRSRESAVVMLADVVEAAVRTLKKPSTSRLEKFIQELIMSKFEQGQLSESELTFRDLETIKKAFVRVLAGHYHSRIDYPKVLKENSSHYETSAPQGPRG